MAGAPAAVSLRPEDVTGFVFWTRNAGTFLEDLAEVRRRGMPFILQMTVTGYPRSPGRQHHRHGPGDRAVQGNCQEVRQRRAGLAL